MTDFERDVLLDDARRIIVIVKETMGEHADPDAESTEAWLERCNEWLGRLRRPECRGVSLIFRLRMRGLR